MLAFYSSVEFSSLQHFVAGPSCIWGIKRKRWLFDVHQVYEFLIVPFGGQAWDTLSPTQIQTRGHGRALVSVSHPCSKEAS